MTENAGFATGTPAGIPPEEMAGQVGRAFPDLAEVTIRANPCTRTAAPGPNCRTGEIGEICYHPPIVFAGYFNMPEETAKAVSRKGILYTGDLGRFEDKGSYRALYLSGRKFMIKQKGYNVFPDEVEDHIARMAGVAAAEVVGMPHDLFDEGIVAFVQPEDGTPITPEQVMDHCKAIASFKRPQHVVIWPADEAFPLTRTAKVDKLALKARAAEIIDGLRREGGWDR
jgi:fatty-acyl-CoA synthase